MLSIWMTEGIGWSRQGGDEMKMDFIDVRRAYFHADALRDVYIELPQEDAQEGMCGKLAKAMYGTRDAAQNWEVEYSAWLEQVGLIEGEASPCALHHPRRNLRMVVHGDDFTILGMEEDRNSVDIPWMYKLTGLKKV